MMIAPLRTAARAYQRLTAEPPLGGAPEQAA
jgi:hypothetical protein